MKGAVVHDFRELLEFSEDLSDEYAWRRFYKGFWPDLVAAVRVDVPGEAQHVGVDRLLYLSSDRVIRVDEKKRERDYGDFCAEIMSVVDDYDPATGRIRGIRADKPGWAVDSAKRCDYIAYAIIPTRTAWLLPYDVLRVTVKREWRRWRQEARARRPGSHGWVAAKNKGYWTLSVSVPWGELHRCMLETMQRNWSGELVLAAQVEP